MAVVAALVHLLLLGLPWLLTREPWAGVAVLLWVLGSAAAQDAGPAGPVPRSEQRRAILLLSVLVVSLVTSTGLHGALAAAGSALLLLGLSLRKAAIRTLGRHFTAHITTAHSRIHTGPYRWLDHPSELGLATASLGFAVLCGSAPGMMAWAAAVVAPSVLRCRAEDRAWASTAS